MLNNTILKSGSRPERKIFATIDDAKRLAQELTDCLEKLTQQRHPLDIRRGVAREGVSDVGEKRESKVVKAGSRTYFIDVEDGKNGEPFLRITESRFKSKDSKERERSSIIVFRDNIGEFAKAIAEMSAMLM